MNTVYFDAAITDDERRRQLFDGQLHVYSGTPGSRGLVEHATRMIREVFGDLDPELAQYHMPAEQYAAVLAELKPKFIHHPDSKRHIQQLLADLKCDLERTYFDVPRMRTATSDEYLTTGIAYAFHPHRDTWYSAPLCQLNWWIPAKVSSNSAARICEKFVLASNAGKIGAISCHSILYQSDSAIGVPKSVAEQGLGTSTSAGCGPGSAARSSRSPRFS